MGCSGSSEQCLFYNPTGRWQCVKSVKAQVTEGHEPCSLCSSQQPVTQISEEMTTICYNLWHQSKATLGTDI